MCMSLSATRCRPRSRGPPRSVDRLMGHSLARLAARVQRSSVAPPMIAAVRRPPPAIDPTAYVPDAGGRHRRRRDRAGVEPLVPHRRARRHPPDPHRRAQQRAGQRDRPRRRRALRRRWSATASRSVTTPSCTGAPSRTAALIGMGAIVLDGVGGGRGSLVGAGALVTPGTVIPPRSLVLGSPAKRVRELSDAELRAPADLGRELRRARAPLPRRRS